jgi:hypothetical protein
MADSTRTSTPNPDQEPGHYGAGYGEQVPEDAAPQLGPATDGDPSTARGEGSADSARGTADVTRDQAAPTEGDDGAPVVFTPADVHARPPDHPPTEAAPESEKAGLIFERS